MPTIPSHISPTLQAIHARREADARADDQGDSTFIRASGAYHECARSTWYDFRWASQGEGWSARMLRLFRTGYMHEARILADLENIEGTTVLRVDPETGKQFEVEIAGYISGHTDGTMLGVIEAPKTWHLIECKTANQKSFAAIKAKGVERGKPEHWLQAHLYMLGTGLSRCFYFLVNKDTDEEYVERLNFNEEFVSIAVARLVTIAETSRPPGKISDNPEFFVCMFCKNKGICHGGKVARVNCRTCISSVPRPGGNWWCEHWGRELTPEAQADGCSAHVWIPDLVNGEQIDADEAARTVTYRMPGGQIWIDGDQEKALEASI